MRFRTSSLGALNTTCSMRWIIPARCPSCGSPGIGVGDQGRSQAVRPLWDKGPRPSEGGAGDAHGLRPTFNLPECLMVTVVAISKHGVFASLAELIEALDVWTSHWNDDPRPFMWTKTANEIITKVKRGRARLNHVTKSATDH